ncbi:type II toxin-antitoxin system VapC family toxin [Candidatus Burkholderia verschuerenii]|uniref:type II toxin-antitoxin system VapC family toxin n=1 Tax=Candidatus Burkholderia verschuerenii TaxID=242163 RepID=UPI00351AA504
MKILEMVAKDEDVAIGGKQPVLLLKVRSIGNIVDKNGEWAGGSIIVMDPADEDALDDEVVKPMPDDMIEEFFGPIFPGTDQRLVRETIMRVLLDTHIYVWRISKDRRLSARHRSAIEQAKQVYVSTASIWELSIKAARGKLEPRAERAIDELEDHPFIELPVQLVHARAVRELRHLHRDPFDRLLVAQAITEDLHFLTADRELSEPLPA